MGTPMQGITIDGASIIDGSVENVDLADADLRAIAALTSAANKVPYSTGAGAWALADFSAFGRSLVDDADAAASRTTLGLGTAAVHAHTDYDTAGAAAAAAAASQPLDADLTAIAALTSAADQMPYSTGAAAWAMTTITSFGRSLVDDANAAAARTTLGLPSWNQAGSDIAPTAGVIEAQGAYAQAATNIHGGTLHLSAGMGIRRITIVDWSTIDAGVDTLSIEVNGTTTTITAGTGWVPATSNDVTAGLLATYINGLAIGVTATAVAAVVYLAPATTTYQCKISTTMTAGEGLAFNGNGGGFGDTTSTSGGIHVIDPLLFGTALVVAGQRYIINAAETVIGGNLAIGLQNGSSTGTVGAEFYNDAFDASIRWTAYGSAHATLPGQAVLIIDSASAKVGVLSFSCDANCAFISLSTGHTLDIGGVPESTPDDTFLRIGESSRAGTDVNVGSSNGYIETGLGSGTGTPGSLIFRTATITSSGSGVQSYGTRFTIATASITSTVALLFTDNTVDIGATAANRPRSLYLAGGTDVKGLAIEAHSLTVSNASSTIDMAVTWNTSGTPTAILLNVTDTASNASSLLMSLRVGGAVKFSVDKFGLTTVANNLAVGSTCSAVNFCINGDTYLARDAANNFAIRNGANNQLLSIYGTYTNSTNYERMEVGYQGGAFQILGRAAGTGSNRYMIIGPVGSASLQITTNGSTRWEVNSSGHLIAGANNSYDIGASGATSPRSIYFGTSIFQGATKILGAQGAAVTDAAAIGTYVGADTVDKAALITSLTDLRTQLNLVLARMRASTGHGLIA